MTPTTWMFTPTQAQPWQLSPAAGMGGGGLARLSALARGFEPISLAQMEAVALLNRVDTKFVLTGEQLLRALAPLRALEAQRAGYWMLEVGGQRLNRYRTLYFDTHGFELFHAHVNDRPERYKVRCREYVDTHLSFLEVKRHTRKDRTVKERLRTPRPVLRVTEDMQRWLEGVSPLDGSALAPRLWNAFTRLTLVGRRLDERVTLDVDLCFWTGERFAQLDGIAIAEVKMGAAGGESPFLAQMRAQRIHPRGFSKYAMGVGLLYEQVKKNALKAKFLMLDKMMKGMVWDD